MLFHGNNKVDELLIKKFLPRLSNVGDGAIIGGLAAAITSFVSTQTKDMISKSYVQSTGAYLNRPRMGSLSAMPGPRNHQVPYQLPGMSGLVTPSRQFRSNAWSVNGK